MNSEIDIIYLCMWVHKLSLGAEKENAFYRTTETRHVLSDYENTDANTMQKFRFPKPPTKKRTGAKKCSSFTFILSFRFIVSVQFVGRQ